MKNRLSYPTGPVVRIGGQTVSLTVARYDYRCQECLGELRYKDSRVICATNSAHTGFIHKKEAARLQEQQAANIQELSNFYQIKKGKVVINGN